MSSRSAAGGATCVGWLASLTRGVNVHCNEGKEVAPMLKLVLVGFVCLFLCLFWALLSAGRGLHLYLVLRLTAFNV